MLASLLSSKAFKVQEVSRNTAGSSQEEELCLKIFAPSKPHIEQCKAELERRQQDALQISIQRKKPAGAAKKYMPHQSKVSFLLKV